MSSSSSSPVRLTNFPAIKNAPFPAEGNGSFSNLALAGAVVVVPYFVKKWIPLVNRGGFWTYFVLAVLLGVPVTVGYWTIMSYVGKRKNEKLTFPGKPIEHYITFHDPELKEKYSKGNKIPMQIAYDAYFDGKLSFNGDVLEVLEWRHDWAAFTFTWELFRYVLFTLIPEVIVHSPAQDESQVRDHYDRGDDFYEWFLGPRMIYTCGIIGDPDREETLEELQDNKLVTVCEKLRLQPSDKLLDIGCGWGTLVAFAGKNYKCDVTGVTLARNQTAFGNKRLVDNGVSPDKGRILCMDFRDVPHPPGHFTKIVSLEMAEHVGIRRYGAYLRQVYDLLDDDGIFVLQVAGFRPHWQYEDLIWGIFMNKYVFPGADASCSLGWVITQVESAGFEVKNVDVLGVHYSATIWRWYKNWLSNKDKAVAKYGIKLYRIWEYFLASAVITSRQGGASLFQLTLHKNLNAYPRIDAVKTHASVHLTPSVPISSVE
ncbi:hypothetical protein FRB99_002058 [Tulasnella sp. 403]|nr:hypothetical protein FRB99_002058 [Tulasnella sp. 403]